MRVMRLVIVLFGLMLALTGGVLAVGHQQSADGLWKIVFTANTGEGWRYVEILPMGKVIEHQTTVNGNLLWSPDNEWVVFFAPIGFSSALTVARPDGSGRRVLLKDISYDFEPAWSPDSAWIYYEYQVSPEAYDLARVGVADGQIETFGFDGRVYCCRWSADGEWVLILLREADRRQHIIRMRPDGSDRHTVFSAYNAVDEGIYRIDIPEFAGNDWIVFVADQRVGGKSLYRIRPDGSELQAIGRANTTGFAPLTISGDGEWVAFVENQLSASPNQLIRLRIDGTQRDMLYGDNRLADMEVWSPDGQFIVLRLRFNQLGTMAFNEININSRDISRAYELTSVNFLRPHYLPVLLNDYRWSWWAVLGGVIVGGGLIDTMRRNV